MSVKKLPKDNFLNSELNHLSKPYRVQSAAVLSSKDVSVEQMYQISNRMESNWGIEGYEVAKKYADPLLQIKEREYSAQKKGQKNKNYVTKRGNYLEDLKKVTDGVPAPNKYEITKPWVEPKAQVKKPGSAPPKRMTFIDQIYRDQQLNKFPGTGKYNLEKTEEEKKAAIEKMKNMKIAPSERPNFLCEYEYLAHHNPGPGAYNPRAISAKPKVNTTKPKDMIAKHKEQDSKRVKSAFPDVGTYNPEPAEYKSFGKMLVDKKDKGQQSKKNYLGTEVRFKDPTKSKSKLDGPVPGPGSYALMAKWPGKEEGMKKDKSKNWMEGVSKGIQRSIYY